jgi:nicotinamide-nucleotide adenylyltransferase
MESPANSSYVAILGRWQPVHLGHQAVLTSLCEQFKRVVIGIGSANIHNYRNPFSVSEVTEMLRLSLPNYHNFKLLPVPDMANDQEWCQLVTLTFGQPEFFITANPYVKSLLDHGFSIERPVSFVPHEKQVAISATMVRREMAKGDDWRDLLPPAVTRFILEKGLDQRFRQQFGLHTLAMEVILI